jgi:hypothetical protein
VPATAAIALLVNPDGPTANSVVQDTQEAAHALGRRLLVLRASNEREIDTAWGPPFCWPALEGDAADLANLMGWLRVTAAAISFPDGVERSLTQKPWRPGNAFTWNRSTSRSPLYSRDLSASPRYFFLFVLRQIKDAIGGCGVSLFLDREQVSHASSARAGRSRQCQAKWAGPRVVHTALVTASFLVGRSLEPRASGPLNRLLWLI